MQKTFTTTTGKTNTVTLVKGDIAQVPAQALITAINSAGMWFGGIDGVIQRCAEIDCHDQVSDQNNPSNRPLQHLDTIVAKKIQSHRGMFQDVVFVIDDLQGPLHKVIYAALEAAGEAGYHDVSLPAIRTGVMLGKVEKDAKTAVGELLAGISDYYDDNPDSSISHITFVIYDGEEVYRLLEISKLLV